jgi:hypothetical protein
MSSKRICRLRHAGFFDDADVTGKQQTLYKTQFTRSRRSAGVFDLQARGMTAYRAAIGGLGRFKTLNCLVKFIGISGILHFQLFKILLVAFNCF